MLEEVMAKDGYPLTLEGRPNFGSVYYEAVRKEYACKHPDKDFVRELSKNYHATKKDFEENIVNNVANVINLMILANGCNNIIDDGISVQSIIVWIIAMPFYFYKNILNYAGIFL